jgi:hypothetical protein
MVEASIVPTTAITMNRSKPSSFVCLGGQRIRQPELDVLEEKEVPDSLANY